MKKHFLLFLIVLVSIKMYSQESYIDIIAKETCEYLSTDEMKNIEPDKISEKLGLFMISLYSKYENELSKEGVMIDFSDGDNSGRAFGEKIGINMVKFCPDALMALASGLNQDESEINETYEVTGKLLEVIGTEFSTLVLKDEGGKTQKFLWLQNFKGSDELIQALEINNTPLLTVKYRNVECFSPQLKDYIIRKEIIEVNFIE